VRQWTVYPAIDLRRGRVVRLRQGDPAQETAYDSEPANVARRWLQAGAAWLHVVNLDGALDQEDQANRHSVREILRLGLHVQFGGGLRDLAAIQEALAWGVHRAVIGTAVLESPELLPQALAEFGSDRIAVAIDARAGKVHLHGWQQGADVEAAELACRCAGQGLRWLMYTNIARDGMGTGVDVQGTLRLAYETGLQVVASGGVRSLEDIQAVYDAGLAGVIVGRALYEAQLSLEDALCIGKDPPLGAHSRAPVEG